MSGHVEFKRKNGLPMNRFLRVDFFRVITGFTALVSVGCVTGLVIFLIVQSVPILADQKWNFLLGQDWWAGEVYGALPMIYGSCLVTGLALVLALPLAISGAVFTSEFLPAKQRLRVKALMELFAGIPGIIYGLLGVAFLTGWVKESFGLIDGNTVLTAGLLLAIMILPTILTVSEDALHSVPGQYRAASLSLGLTKLQMITGAVIPAARPGIAGAIFLGLGRALGETIAVMLVIGGLDKIADPWYDLFAPAQSIASKLGREAAEAIGTDQQWSALMALGLVLFSIVMFFTLMGNLFMKESDDCRSSARKNGGGFNGLVNPSHNFDFDFDFGCRVLEGRSRCGLGISQSGVHKFWHLWGNYISDRRDPAVNDRCSACQFADSIGCGPVPNRVFEIRADQKNLTYSDPLAQWHADHSFRISGLHGFWE